MKTRTRHGANEVWFAFPLLLATAACSSEPAGPESSSNATEAVRAPVEQTESAGEAENANRKRLITGEVKRYDYQVDLGSGSVRAALDVRVAPPGGTCFSAACQADATDAQWNGRPARSSELSAGQLLVCGRRVHGGDFLHVGAQAAIPAQTFLGLDVGFSRKKDLAGGTFTYLLSWIEGCSHFGVCDPDPSRLAEYHFEVSHAPGETVLCPGKLSAGASRTRCDLARGHEAGDARALAPTYSSVGVASDPLWKRNPLLTTNGGLNVVFYEVPGGAIAESLDKPSIREFFDWISGYLGPFPYGDELRFAGAPTHWLGFEHPANIVLYEKLQTVKGAYANPTMHVVMHETTHQWAGNRATLASVGDFVWKEATAEYLSYVFERDHRPAGEAEATRAYWDRISLLATHHPRPTDEPLPAVQDFYTDVYGPGPMVLYVQLEALIGKDRVLEGIRSFLARPGARSVDDLREALEDASDADLSDYFDAWVFGKGKPAWPKFDVTTSQRADGDVVVTVTQSSAAPALHGCVVEVEVESTTGAKTLARVNFGLHPSSASASTVISLGGGT
ncbi:MAG TPA: M1 family aminopeptidase, partial [Polyangiaceae bacterium]|nr:M1 family aminopeptidase [Polyangiaceae bacterium]